MLSLRRAVQDLALDSVYRLFEVVSYGTLLITVSNKNQHSHALKKVLKTGLQIVALVKYVTD